MSTPNRTGSRQSNWINRHTDWLCISTTRERWLKKLKTCWVLITTTSAAPISTGTERNRGNFGFHFELLCCSKWEIPKPNDLLVTTRMNVPEIEVFFLPQNSEFGPVRACVWHKRTGLIMKQILHALRQAIKRTAFYWRTEIVWKILGQNILSHFIWTLIAFFMAFSYRVD